MSFSPAIASTTRQKARPPHGDPRRGRAIQRSLGSGLGRLPGTTRAALARIPTAAWICALVAVLNAACWSIITPPFQIPDEPSHFAYVQQLAENDRLPTSNEEAFSPDEEVALRDLHQYEVRGSPENRTIASRQEQTQLQSDLESHLSRSGPGGAGGARNGPPLYYLLLTVPYALASAGTLLDQLELMRLFSALMAGITALFAFLFVREALPAERWAWTVGGLGVALAPMLGFMSGAVNPDAMLFAVSAAVFYCLARGFRRGASRGLLVALGVLTAAGLLSKLNFIGLVPGVVLGMCVLALRGSRTLGSVVFRWLGLALAIAASPVLLYVLFNLISNRPTFGIVSHAGKLTHASLMHQIGYIWQLYLPRLPGMSHDFPGLFTARQLWFDRSVGFYGWLDTSFPEWVATLALAPALLLAALFAKGMLSRLDVLRSRLIEIVVYGAMTIGLLILIGASAYLNMDSEGLGTAEPRYLLPLLPLLAAVYGVSVRAISRRAASVIGVLIVMIVLGHDIFSQLLVVSRYYG